jgi:hypothetical protein
MLEVLNPCRAMVDSRWQGGRSANECGEEELLSVVDGLTTVIVMACQEQYIRPRFKRLTVTLETNQQLSPNNVDLAQTRLAKMLGSAKTRSRYGGGKGEREREVSEDVCQWACRQEKCERFDSERTPHDVDRVE